MGELHENSDVPKKEYPIMQPPLRWVPPSSVAEFEMRFLEEGQHLTQNQSGYVDKILTAENFICLVGKQGGVTFVRNAIMRMIKEAEEFEYGK